MSLILDDVAKFITSKVEISNIDETNYISTENMLPNKGGVCLATSLPETKSVRKYIPNDILLNNIRPYFKKIWFANKEGGCSNDVFVLRSKENYDSKFLYYVLSSDDFFSYVMANAKGTKMPRGDKKAIKNYEVPNFSLKDQRKISHFLSSIDEKIETNKKINKKLYLLSQQIYKKWFVDFEYPISDKETYKSSNGDFKIDEGFEIPVDMEVLKISDVCDCQNGHAFYKDGYDDDGLMVVDLGNISLDGNFIYTDSDKYLSRERIPNEKFLVKKDDLIMVMTDRKSTMDLLGKTAKIYEDKEYVLNQRIFRIRPHINTNFIYSFLNSSNTHNILKSEALGSVQKYINTNHITDLKIVVPSEELMEKYSKIVDSLFSQMEINILENKKLGDLRTILLPKLMSGEIDVSEVNCDLY